MKRLLLIALIVVAALAGYLGWRARHTAGAEQAATLTQYLTEDGQEGFARATEPGTIAFPRDLGPHPDYQTEWWYYTGNLETAAGRPFGFQFTIFRRALTPEENTTEGKSAWRTNQVYFAHLALSDVDSGAFYDFEKFSRGAAGLAGATAEPYQVWIEDWSVREQDDGRVRLFAQADNVQLDLVLAQTRPPVLHGNQGLSTKGSEPGNASYYYSLVDQATAGTLTIGDMSYDVTGHTWKDHEYSTSALSEGALGWDWFSLVFDNADDNALMFFQIRREDGRLQAESAGSWIAADGSVQPLDVDDVQIEVLETWTSPASGAEYPAGWRLQIPSVGLDITGEPLMPNQELNVSTTYWEGAVRFEGTLAGEPVAAEGYIEMTGYVGALPGRN